MNIPAQISETNEKLQSWWSGADVVKRVGVLGGVTVTFVIVLLLLSTLPKNADEWEGRILYANLEFSEAADISNYLRGLEVPHRLSQDATAIIVPEKRYMELRVQLAGEGFPKSGRIGYEIFDEAQLAMTDFLQKVNYQRALQAEIEQTLINIDGVRNSRVHLVIPEPSLFTEEQNPVTASVTLNLDSGVRLRRERIDAIGYLLSASVEGLDIADVVILDGGGNLLSEEKDPLVKIANKQFELQQQVEDALEEKVQTLMNSVIGNENSRVRINVVLDFNQRQTQLKTLEPGSGTVISEETQETQSAEKGTEEQAVRNYEVNETVQNIVGSIGAVSKLSMALTVDKTKVVITPEGNFVEETRSQQEINDLANLAKEAVGLDQSRGDQITVVPMVFDKTGEIRARETELAEERWEFWTNIAFNVAKVLGIVIALFTLRFIIQAIGRGVGVEDELEVLGELASEVEEEEFARPETPHDILVGRIQNMVRERPEDAAKLVRTMMVDQN